MCAKRGCVHAAESGKEGGWAWFAGGLEGGKGFVWAGVDGDEGVVGMEVAVLYRMYREGTVGVDWKDAKPGWMGCPIMWATAVV
jgi:hypothetical protein